jgi:cell division protein FtsW (lipid II flippase)
LGSDNGPKRWFSLGGFNLQPSEFAKISIILITSQIWEKNSGERMLRKLGRMFRVRRLGRGRKTISKSKELKDTDIDLEVDEQSAKKGLWVRAKKRIEHMDLSYIYNLVWNSILVLPILLLILIQPSLGNTIITAGIWLLLLSTLIQRPVTNFIFLVYLMV